MSAEEKFMALFGGGASDVASLMMAAQETIPEPVQNQRVEEVKLPSQEEDP
jgi:hypothetical protein